MKKTLLLTALAAVFSVSVAQAAEKLVVGATPIPHQEILELIKPDLAKEGVDLQIKVFTDYVQPNVQLNEKRLDANYFQTKPYLEGFNKGKGATLVTGVGVHVEPFGGYSRKYKDIKDLPEDGRGRYNTMAGLLMSVSGQLPSVGERVECAGWVFEVVDLDGKRIDKVLARQATAAERAS